MGDIICFKKIYYLIPMMAFLGCKSSYHNKELYHIKIGETFEVYVAENFCCFYSWANSASVKSVKMVEEKLVKAADRDCDGCSSIYG